MAASVLVPPSRGCFLPPRDRPAKLWLEAEIEDAATPLDDGVRVAVRARVPAGLEPVCGRVLLAIRGVSSRSLPVGARVRLHASLRRPRNFANPRAFDHAGSLARRGIWVTGHASNDGLVTLSATGATPSRLARLRERIGADIDASLPAPHAALLRSLVIGDEAAVPAELWDAIAAAGLAHFLSVSGLHIALVWGLVLGAVRWALARSERLLLYTHVRAIAAGVALVPAALYAALAGLSVPAARSVAMTALFVTSLAAGREVEPLRVLCLAAATIAVIWPGSPLEVSFQLSFASVLALILAAERWLRLPQTPTSTRREWWQRHALVMVVVPAAALAGTAPLVALHFNRFTPIGLLTNPILVPLSGTPATVLGLLGAVLSTVSEPLCRMTFALAYWPLELFRVGVETAAAIPLASIRVPTPTLIEEAVAYALLALPWVPAPRRRPVLAVAMVVLMLDLTAWAYERWLHTDLRVRFLDVGQGDAAVVELPGGEVLVVDGGGFARSHFDVGERVVGPYLWSRKILRTDYLLATHGDWDHQGGLHFLAKEFAPRELWVGAPAAERARLRALERETEAAGGRVRTLRPGEVPLIRGDFRLECLHPPADESLSSNDSSLVLLASGAGRAVLFTGDIESPGERLLAAGPAVSTVTALKVPHHGSRTSSSEALLRWARPEIAVFSLGAGNGYGFPDPLVVERYDRLGVRSFRTDRDGSVWIAIDAKRVVVRSEAEAWPVVCAAFGWLC